MPSRNFRSMRIRMTPFRFLCRFAALATLALAATAIAQAPTPAPAQARVPAGPRPGTAERSVLLDRVVAVVNDEALTQFEIDEQKKSVLAQMKSQNVTPPAADVLDKQLLDRLITERAITQFAKENGVKVDDTQVERAILRIARANSLWPAGFRAARKREAFDSENSRKTIG